MKFALWFDANSDWLLPLSIGVCVFGVLGLIIEALR